MKRDVGVHATLATLLAIVALNAFGGGWYGVTGAEGVPRAWLDGSPFSSYFVPSLFLLVVVGGGCAVATFAVLARWRFRRQAAVGAGLVCLAWIAAQIAIIGVVSWLQPAVAAAGVVIVALGRRLSEPLPAPEQHADRHHQREHRPDQRAEAP